MNKNQIKREALFAQQGSQCALCTSPCPTSKGLIYVPAQNALLCRVCGSWVSNHRNALSRGLTIAQLDAFLARDPAPEPTPTASAQVVQLKPAQVQGLRSCLAGQSISLTEWCGRAGIEEEDALQYARQHGIAV